MWPMQYRGGGGRTFATLGWEESLPYIGRNIFSDTSSLLLLYDLFDL